MNRIILLIITISSSLADCQNILTESSLFKTELIYKYDNQNGQILDFDFGENGKLIILSAEVDSTQITSPMSSHLPIKRRLWESELKGENQKLIVDNLPDVRKLKVDDLNNIWLAGNSGLLRIINNKLDYIIKNERLDFLEIDNQNHVWTGKCCSDSTCLIQVDQNLNKKYFSKENSDFLTNKIDYIFISGNDNIWVGFEDNYGLLTISNSKQTLYNTDDTKLLRDLDYESMIEDENGDLWIGGNNGKKFQLLKYDGKQWIDKSKLIKIKESDKSFDELGVFKEGVVCLLMDTWNFSTRLGTGTLYLILDKKVYDLSEMFNIRGVEKIYQDSDSSNLIVKTRKELIRLTRNQ